LQQLRREILGAGIGHIGRQAVTALIKLSHLVGMTFLAHSRSRLAEHVGAFVLNSARVVNRDFVAGAAGDLGGRHRADAVLLYDTRSRAAVADNTFVVARGQGIHPFSLRADSGLTDSQHNQRQA
jgi:hypothetical protein